MANTTNTIRHLIKIAFPFMVVLFFISCRPCKNSASIIYKDTTIYVGGHIDTLIVIRPDTILQYDTTRYSTYSYSVKNDTLKIYYAVKDTIIKLDSVIQIKEVIKYVNVKQEVNKCQSVFHKYLTNIFWTLFIILLLYILIHILK